MSAVDQLYTLFLSLGALLLTAFIGLYEALLFFVPRSFRRKDISGEIVLITGGGSGIGRLMALNFADKGAKIVSWDINNEGNEETAKLIRSKGGKCFTYTVNICNRQEVYETAAKVKKDVGKVDILINNAGIITGKFLLDCPDESISRTFDVNVISHFWTIKAFLPDMISKNKGHIVTIASLAGFFASPSLVDYCSTKFATIGLDEALRFELETMGKRGIKTTCVCPYYINTGMFAGVDCGSFVPMLKQEDVANETVDAVLMNQQLLVLPFIFKFMILLKGMIPCSAEIFFQKASGMDSAMKSFVGRQKKK